MRVSVRLLGLGLLLVCTGVISLWEPDPPLEVEEDDVRLAAIEQTAIPLAEIVPTQQPTMTRTPLPVTVLPTETVEVVPTAQLTSMDTVLLNNNVYRESFTDMNSGWDQYYVGDGGAWNGYVSMGYSFQLANDAQLAVGRRIWDFNTCCILESQYRVSLEAESQSPQRGMLITEFAGDYTSMDVSSGIVVLFDIGYNMQPRPQPVQVVLLQQGYPALMQCTGASELVVGPRMKISVTVVDGMLTATVINRNTDDRVSLRCGLDQRSLERKQLGIGAVRLPNTQTESMAPLVYTSLEIVGIDNYITDSRPMPAVRAVLAGCNAQQVSSFEEWLNIDILYACPVY